MTWIATCTDCSWDYQTTDQVEAADALDRHARKEHHHVNIQRHAATPA